MSLTYNGTEVQGVTYNGNEVQSITYNGVEVWSAAPHPKANLKDNRPEDIQYAAQNDLAASLWDIGDYFEMTLNGEWQCTNNTITLNNYVVRCELIGINHNADKEGNHLLHFQIGKNADGVNITFRNSGMNTTDTNSGGWKSCGQRTVTMANLYSTIIPSNWRAVIKPCTKYTDNTGGGSDNSRYVTATSDNCFLLAAYEVFGSLAYANNAERNYQKQYAYYANGNSKKRYSHNDLSDANNWWLRSPSVWNSTNFGLVTTDQNNVNVASSLPGAVTPAFCIG